MNKITVERLKKVLAYDENSGNLIWLISKCGNRAGTIAGCLARGYISIRVDGVNYRAHRLAWLYMTGDWPDQIDHVNHIRNDNRWCNLRDVTHKENHMNNSMSRNNTSGITGIDYMKARNKWRARVNLNYKAKHLGVFSDFFEACCARKSAECKYGFHENHGRPK